MCKKKTEYIEEKKNQKGKKGLVTSGKFIAFEFSSLVVSVEFSVRNSENRNIIHNNTCKNTFIYVSIY